MSTVSKQPVPPKTITPKLVSDSWSGNYARPTAGGNASGQDIAGNPVDAPAGPTPGYSINMTGAPVGAANTQAGPDMGHGATIVVPNSGDRPSGGKETAGPGTVGPDSGPGLGQ